jgi:hypothetical protein
MYSVMFSCRMDLREGEAPLERLLDSFEALTSEEEKSKSEFLIKFDTDDKRIPPDAFFDKYNFTIKKFVWDRYGGRSSLHEVQNVLYNHVREDCQFVQVIADDFIFTRPNFVEEILQYSGQYVIIGEKGMGDHVPPAGSGGYAPCFSTKIIDATSGFGSHCNSDGFAFGLAEELEKRYGYQVVADFLLYYRRLDHLTTQDPDCKFIELCHANRSHVFTRLARNIIANLEIERSSMILSRMHDME